MMLGIMGIDRCYAAGGTTIKLSLSPDNNSLVSTGDTSSPYLLLIVAILSLIVLTSIGYYWFSAKRKVKNKEK